MINSSVLKTMDIGYVHVTKDRQHCSSTVPGIGFESGLSKYAQCILAVKSSQLAQRDAHKAWCLFILLAFACWPSICDTATDFYGVSTSH